MADSSVLCTGLMFQGEFTAFEYSEPLYKLMLSYRTVVLLNLQGKTSSLFRSFTTMGKKSEMAWVEHAGAHIGDTRAYSLRSSIDSNKWRDSPKMMHQKHRKTRKTVGTRLYRVRHSWNSGPQLFNHGRDTIGSLPFSAHCRHSCRACVIFSEIVGANVRSSRPYRGDMRCTRE